MVVIFSTFIKKDLFLLWRIVIITAFIFILYRWMVTDMPKYQQNERETADGVNLLISILVRFPEIATLRFDSIKQIMKITFMVSSALEQEEFTSLRRLILDSIAVYQMLQGGGDAQVNMEMNCYDGISIITLFRDMNTLSQGEIAVCIALLREHCRDRLVSDRSDALLEDELQLQEELIDNMFEQVKNIRAMNNLIGIREDGRVFVYNK